LTPAHGAPWRVIVPGYIGARSVKWLSRIVISDRPSDNSYVTHSYRLVAEDTPAAWEAAPILYGQPLQSLICTVRPADDDAAEYLKVSGYAMPSGDDDSVIERVEVSTNGGRTWKTAQLDDESQPYCWRFWSVRMRRPMEPRRILVRAIDSRWRIQPETVDWNAKGYMFNAWHSVDIPSG
jgi:sulfite oxidase